MIPSWCHSLNAIFDTRRSPQRDQHVAQRACEWSSSWAPSISRRVGRDSGPFVVALSDTPTEIDGTVLKTRPNFLGQSGGFLLCSKHTQNSVVRTLVVTNDPDELVHATTLSREFGVGASGNRSPSGRCSRPSGCACDVRPRPLRHWYRVGRKAARQHRVRRCATAGVRAVPPTPFPGIQALRRDRPLTLHMPRSC